MLNKNLEIELNKQKILPILNTTELHDDIKRLEVFLLKNPNIKNIEISNLFEILFTVIFFSTFIRLIG